MSHPTESRMSALPFRSQVLREGRFEIGGRSFFASEVVEKLEPHLTPERVRRVTQVVDGRTYSIATVAEHLYDIGNISAVMRSAESFGFLSFHLIERSGARYKMSDRISRGSEKWLDIHKYSATSPCVSTLKSQGFQVFATDLNATHNIEDIDFSQKVAFVFGNEKDGISEEVRSLADGRFRIPMYGFAQSFNISVAAALCFYHAHMGRCRKLGSSGDLTEEEKLNLKAHYYLRTLDRAPDILLR